jgi:hypothetical protein
LDKRERRTSALCLFISHTPPVWEVLTRAFFRVKREK